MSTAKPLAKHSLKIKNNLKLAWRLLKGTKLPVWVTCLGWLVMTLGILGVAWVIKLVAPWTNSLPRVSLMVLTWVIIMLTAPLFAGMHMIAIKRARNESVNVFSGFQYFRQWLPLALGFLIIAFISFILIGVITLGISFGLAQLFHSQEHPPILLALITALTSAIIINLAYALMIFLIPLIADQRRGVFYALKTSAATARKNWIKLFDLLLIFYGINFVTLLICEIPFVGFICYVIINIWLIPFIFLNIGIAYHQLIDRETNYAQPLLP